MSRITFNWYDDDQTMLYVRYGKGWTHQDVFRTFSETFEMIESVNHPVDVVVEMIDQNVPPNIISITSMLKTRISANQRHIYIVGANTFIQILLRAAAAALPTFERVTFCHNVDEALRRLRQDRDGLAARASSASRGSSYHNLD